MSMAAVDITGSRMGETLRNIHIIQQENGDHYKVRLNKKYMLQLNNEKLEFVLTVKAGFKFFVIGASRM